jgi:[ribosomal protein S18]-alanine N-acetyltransferase
MTREDASACATLQEDSFGSSRAASGTAFSESQIQEELIRPWSRLWCLFPVAAENSAGVPEVHPMLGCVVAWHVLDEIHLLNIAVASYARKRGYAKRLMNELLKYGRENCAQRIILEVRVDNHPARGLYEAFGFETTRIRKNYYGGTADDPAVDGLEMILPLQFDLGA